MGNNPALSYQQAAASGASPVGLIVSLYDTILRDCARALKALQDGNVEARISELNHALLVIGHLQSVLNFEQGGDAAKIFEHFYDITRGMIVQANITATRESIEKLIEMYGGMRQAWFQADNQLPPNQQPSSPTGWSSRASQPAATNPPNEDVETPQLKWSA
jgi:flagellar protein FliS